MIRGLDFATSTGWAHGDANDPWFGTWDMSGGGSHPGRRFSELRRNLVELYRARPFDRVVAVDAGVDELRYVVVASETFNQKNQGTTIETTLADYKIIANRVREAGIKLSCTIGASFGCPFEGEVAVEGVINIAKQLVDGGALEIGLADTIGAAVPTQVSNLIAKVRVAVGSGIGLGCHLHNTRNTGFANAAAAAISTLIPPR